MYMALPDSQFTPTDGSPELSDWKKESSGCVGGACDTTNPGVPVPKLPVAPAAPVACATERQPTSKAPDTRLRARDVRIGELQLGEGARPPNANKPPMSDQGRLALFRPRYSVT